MIMRPRDEHRWLDSMLRDTIGAKRAKPDFARWQHQHPGAVDLLTQRAGRDPVRSSGLLRIRTLIMKRPIRALTAAAVLIGILLLYSLNDSLNTTSTAFAGVKQAVESMPLIHRVLDTYRDGKHYHSENWYSCDTRTEVSKYSVDGRCFKISALNYDTMEYYAYDPNTDVVKRSYRHDVGTSSLSDSPWSLVEEYLQRFEQDNALIEYREGVHEANEVDIYQFSIPRNFRDEKVKGEFVVNRESQLPVLYKRQFRTQQGDLTFDQIIHFAFPENGPNDIYDLGVPRSARVVYDADSKARLALKEKLLKDRQAYERDFRTAYYLDEGQVLKYINPSLIRPRARIDWANDMLRNLTSRAGNEASIDSIDKEFKSVYRYKVFRWDGRLVTRRTPVFEQGVSLQQAFEWIVGLSKFEYQIPDALLDFKIKGDWIVRNGATKTQLLEVLAETIQEHVQRPIHFEHRREEHDVIVASGTFRFEPLSGTYTNTWIHVFSDVMDPDERGGGGSGTLEKFLRMLGDIPLDQLVLNETDSPGDIRVNWGWHYSGYLRRVADSVEKQEKLAMLFDHLSQQTGLIFRTARREVSIWTVTE